MISIEKVDNGYILNGRYGSKQIFLCLDKLFEYLLLHFEGRSVNFSDNRYGKVTIERKE